jgi:hypothetical protein
MMVYLEGTTNELYVTRQLSRLGSTIIGSENDSNLCGRAKIPGSRETTLIIRSVLE